MLKEAVMLSLHMAKDPDPQPRNKVLGATALIPWPTVITYFSFIKLSLNNTEIPDLSLADSL